MRRGPRTDGPEPLALRGALLYCLVWLVDSDEDGWLVDEDCAVEAGWFVEAEADGWLVDADCAVEAGWFVEAEADDEGWLAEADAPIESFMPGKSVTPAAFAWSIAACVRGPLMPSIGPGSKPLSFSACCSCFTDSSPCAWEPELMLSVAEAPLVALAPLVEALEAPAAMLEDWFAEAEAEGWLVEEAGWLADAEAAGWFAEADFSLSELDWPAAIAEPAAINAAARASFLNCMVDVLSYGQLTAVRFGAKAAHKLQAAAAPSDARHLRRIHGGTAT